MREFAFSAMVVILGLGWAMSGRSPLFWGAVGCTHLEALRRQVYASAKTGVLHFWTEYRSTAQAVRAEVAAE